MAKTLRIYSSCSYTNCVQVTLIGFEAGVTISKTNSSHLKWILTTEKVHDMAKAELQLRFLHDFAF